jgi:hypothetical protein
MRIEVHSRAAGYHSNFSNYPGVQILEVRETGLNNVCNNDYLTIYFPIYLSIIYHL